MRTCLHCLPCFAGHTVEALTLCVPDEARRIDAARRILSIAADWDFNLPPPVFARKSQAIVREAAGMADPYREVKDASTALALEMLPSLRSEVLSSPDPFARAVALSIAGNLIDFGATRGFRLEESKSEIRKAMDTELDSNAMELLRNRLHAARNVVYILDNCGEIVFDTVLVSMFKEKIKAVVRGAPILNDATRREASMSGYDGLVEILDTGDAAPGLDLSLAPPPLLNALRSADLVISKGQGNFEMLDDSNLPAVFLLRVKCPVVAGVCGHPLGKSVILHHGHSPGSPRGGE